MRSRSLADGYWWLCKSCQSMTHDEDMVVGEFEDDFKCTSCGVESSNWRQLDGQDMVDIYHELLKELPVR